MYFFKYTVVSRSFEVGRFEVSRMWIWNCSDAMFLLWMAVYFVDAFMVIAGTVTFITVNAAVCVAAT